MNRRLANRVAGFIILALFGAAPSKAQNLSEIFDLALQSDPTLKKMDAQRSAHGESRAQSLARFFPVVSAMLSTTRANATNTKANVIAVPFQEYWNNVASVNLKQPIFHWDHWVQLSQSDNKIAQAEAEYAAEIQNLMLRTATAYFEILSARDTLEFASAEKTAIARQLDQAKQRFEVGIIAITDVNEAQAAFDQAHASEIEAENQLDNKNEALKEIIGEQNVVLDLLGEALPLQKPEPADMLKWSETAELNNFGVIAAYNQAEAARKEIELKMQGHLPELDLVAAFQQTDNTNLFGARGDTESVGLQLNVPIFEGGAVLSRTRQAEYEHQAAKENLEAVKRTVNRQVRDAYRAVLTNISRVEALRTAVESSETSLEATQAGLEVGTRTMVDVLNQQRNLFKAKRDYSRARYDYLINSITLKQLASNLTRDDLEQISRLLLSGGAPAKKPAL